MKALLQKCIAFVLLAFFINAPLLRAGQEGKQPHMEDAISFLHDAKKSSDPIPLLEKAKGELKKASKNKEGQRKKAMEIIGLAIDEAQHGNTQGMISKIDSAIATIHNGMSKAP